MTAWLTDTLLYTGLLIALVLLVRRPVARYFGPKLAYALWALPALRLILPPIELPASMAPHQAQLGDQALLAMAMAADVSPAPAPTPLWERADVWLTVWLAGAVLFIAWRIAGYRRMRREVLAEARPVGEVGRIRLVETPAIGSPVAFGVRDKIVALPLGFMALEDRAGRDLAIAHELAHHRGHDIAANFAAQPLLALHWFNPLAWIGWRAMRRDQEAACDARVLEGRGREERAAYAGLIAGFAAGPRLALAAPMACPIIGEKSIIHRLRSLAMSDVSPRRRLAGRLLLVGAALALPLTASISFASAQ
jgi:beta-lactamase regulating signal transducer with metallopeptidase domain